MTLKNAVAVCLIAMFSATLVVLIARALDSQAASQLAPPLAKIAKELRLLRTHGGGVPATATVTASDPPGDSLDDVPDDGLVVYYFYSNTRCPTCRSIESQAHDVVKSAFASRLTSGDLTWTIANYEQAAAKPLAKKFDIQMPVVVLARMKDGEIQDWNRLDQVWPLVGDKPEICEVRAGGNREDVAARTKARRSSAEGRCVDDPRSKVSVGNVPSPKGRGE